MSKHFNDVYKIVLFSFDYETVYDDTKNCLL